MRYLREGLICRESPDGLHELVELRDGHGWEIDASGADAARRLILGLEGEAAREAEGLLGAENVETREEPFDSQLRERLAELDRGFLWTTPQRDRYAALLDLCEAAHSLLRHSRQDLDQLPVLPETAARRALLLQERCRPGAEVALVGDDDLVAVAAAAVGLKPTVFDLDADLIALQRLLARRLGLDIAVRQLDLRAPLPRELLGAFEACCTDPETSRECIGLFLSRGAALVRPGGLVMIACAEEWAHLVIEAAQKSGLRSLARLRRFGNYRDPMAQLAHYRSDLHLFSVTSETAPLIAAEASFTEPLFTFGLTSGDHLVGVALRCRRAPALELIELARALVGLSDAQPPSIDDRSPLPVRVVTAATPSSRAQLTLRADGETVDIDLHPAPTGEDQAKGATEAIARLLGPAETRLRTLRRLE